MSAATITTHTLSLPDADIYYELHGQGQPLLVLHGFTGSGAGLATQFAPLTANYQLIIPDMRGHGRSTNATAEFTFKQAAADMISLLSHLGINKCYAVGFSGGGCTLLQMAAQQSERIAAMAIISAAPYFPKQTREIMREYYATEKTPEEWQAMRQIHPHGDSQIKLLWEQARRFAENTEDMNLTPEDLANITTKTLIVQGDRDYLYPLSMTTNMYQALPNAYLWLVPNGGHVPVSGAEFETFIEYFKGFIQ
jgi:pimeloyl-ACP methyl ester carboxylesterase